MLCVAKEIAVLVDAVDDSLEADDLLVDVVLVVGDSLVADVALVVDDTGQIRVEDVVTVLVAVVVVVVVLTVAVEFDVEVAVEVAIFPATLNTMSEEGALDVSGE